MGGVEDWREGEGGREAETDGRVEDGMGVESCCCRLQEE